MLSARWISVVSGRSEQPPPFLGNIAARQEVLRLTGRASVEE